MLVSQKDEKNMGLSCDFVFGFKELKNIVECFCVL